MHLFHSKSNLIHLQSYAIINGKKKKKKVLQYCTQHTNAIGCNCECTWNSTATIWANLKTVTPYNSTFSNPMHIKRQGRTSLQFTMHRAYINVICTKKITQTALQIATMVSIYARCNNLTKMLISITLKRTFL